MKYAMYLFVPTLMAGTLHAQTRSSAAAHGNAVQQTKQNQITRAVENDTHDETGAELLLEYAAKVNGLLRELGAAVRVISDQEQAGQLTADDARVLKLAAARAMLA